MQRSTRANDTYQTGARLLNKKQTVDVTIGNSFWTLYV